MNEAPKKFFSIHITGGNVELSVFTLDGPEPHPDDSERVLDRTNFGSVGAFNIASAIEFALKLGAVPYTEEMAALHFWEPEND